MTRRNFCRLPPASWLHTFQTFFSPLSWCFQYWELQGMVIQWQASDTAICVTSQGEFVRWEVQVSILESLPAQGWLTMSSLYTGLFGNHIIHILLNPNEMHYPLKLSFVEFPKCPQLLQCHLPQGEVWWKGNRSAKRQSLNYLTVPNFILTCHQVNIFLEPLLEPCKSPM